jgi:hypothetical protein
MGDNIETAINASASPATKPGPRGTKRKPMDRFRT